jgi:tetratricopeptide (TPR) repeat protein
MLASFRAACAAVIGLALALAVFASPADAGDRILKGPPPAWVLPSDETPTPARTTTGEGLRLLLLDSQLRAEDDQQFVYIRSRSTAASPQGVIALGNIALTWSPASQDITVHHVTLLRDGQSIDVLASQEFETLRREENLQLAMLDGRLTAVLQPAGLRIGDVLDVAYTITSRDSVPGEKLAQAIDLNMPLVVERQRVRASWPTAMSVTVRAADGWIPVPIRRNGAYSSLEIVRENTQPILIPSDVPDRLRDINLIELSAYRDWAEVSATLKPLYDRARRLEPDSPLHAEIARIRALSDDPAVQAAAALRLVQDDIRYVALLMGEGAMTPANADETWTRRFGDCKGKTALLLALLDGLGISAEPAIVSLMQGDVVGERLPTIQGFDHVLVRAVVADRTYWLDGTRMGDRRLEDIVVPPLRWALPLVASNGQLERLQTAPLSLPNEETIIALDASAGQHAPAPVTGSLIMRGDAAAALAGQIGLITPQQRDQGLRGMWTSLLRDATIDEVGSSYDVEANVLTLTAKGAMPLDWSNGGLIPPGSTYQAISAEKRPEGPFRNAPYMVSHPVFSRQVVTVRLPNGGAGFRTTGGQFDRTEFGHHMSRAVKLEGDTATIEVLVQSLTNEITAAEADAGRSAADDRQADYPRIIAPAGSRLTQADQTALAANRPTTEAAWLDRALAFSRAGDAQGAADAASQAVQLAPDSSRAWANRGVYRFWAGDRAGAASDLEKAVDLDPSDRIAMNGNALIAAAEDRYQDVVIEMTRALRQEPTDDFALGMRARAYWAQKQYDRALRDIDALLAADSGRIDMKLFRIGTLGLANRLDERETAVTDILRQHPDDQRVVMFVAEHRLDTGKAQEAYDLLDSLIVDGETVEPFLLVQRAKAAFALGRLDEAARDFQTVREAHSDDPEMLNDLCWSAALAGAMLDQALQDCDAALKLEPNSPAILDSKARVLLQQGNPSAALEIYDAALAKTPELSASLYGRGLARIALGQTSEGEADKAAALELDPTAADDFKSYAPVEAGAHP